MLILAKYDTKDIRNFALISHGGAGKTTFTEMALVKAGVKGEAGTVERGNTASDFTPEEKDKQFSITNSYFSFPWNNRQINLIDTPGYADFRGEAASALSMVEGALLLIDASSGVEVNTHYVWEKARENELCKFIFINKVDKDEVDFNAVHEELQDFCEENLLPLTIPAGTGEDFQGIIDLLSGKLITENGETKEIPEEFQDQADEYHLELIESVVESDDELMMKYLEDEKISDEEITGALFNSVEQKMTVPIFAGVASRNFGVKRTLDYLVKLIPDPTNRPSLKDINGEEVELNFSAESDVLAQVCKTMVDPYIGKLSIFRMYNGRLQKGDELYVPRLDDKLKASKLYKINGSEQNEVEKLLAGDIGAVAKIGELETSDTITEPDNIVELKKLKLPEPMLIQKVTSKEGQDDEKMSNAIQRYSQEDLTFKVNFNRETKELLVHGMGTVHLDVIKKVCQRKFDVSFDTSEPSVEYKETVQSKVDVEEKYKKQSGGRGQYGHVMMKFEPLQRGKGFEFEEEIFGGAVPSQYIPAVEKGVSEAMEEGVLAGYRVVDLKAILYDGSYHDVDSSEMAFKIAASKAFKKAMEQAKPVLLEPIMKIKVVVPDDFMGDIMGDLNSRRGRILGMDPSDGKQIINAEVPQAELFSYATDLKSITGGYGQFSMEFSHYDKVPQQEAEDIIRQRRAEKE